MTTVSHPIFMFSLQLLSFAGQSVSIGGVDGARKSRLSLPVLRELNAAVDRALMNASTRTTRTTQPSPQHAERRALVSKGIPLLDVVGRLGFHLDCVTINSAIFHVATEQRTRSIQEGAR
jgi:hypothetical protein